MKNPTMQFRVSAFKYTVRVQAYIEDTEGKPISSICSWLDRTILILDTLGPEQRLDALLQQLAYAWGLHFGLPEGSHDIAVRQSAFTIDVMRQFWKQGGLARLDNLPASLHFELSKPVLEERLPVSQNVRWAADCDAAMMKIFGEEREDKAA